VVHFQVTEGGALWVTADNLVFCRLWMALLVFGLTMAAHMERSVGTIAFFLATHDSLFTLHTLLFYLDLRRGLTEKTKMPNEPMDLTPMPSALLARRLRSSLWCQKQVGAGHRGRSQKI